MVFKEKRTVKADAWARDEKGTPFFIKEVRFLDTIFESVRGSAGGGCSLLLLLVEPGATAKVIARSTGHTTRAGATDERNTRED